MIITDETYFETWKAHQPISIEKHLKNFAGKNVFPNFGYNISLSAVNSSQIEGNILDMASYTNMNDAPPPIYSKAIQEINDLKDAYAFASKEEFNWKNIIETHKIITDNILKREDRGKLRTREVYVRNTNTGEIIYTGCGPDKLKDLVSILIEELNKIAVVQHDAEHSFFYASQLHYWMCAIHPFADGNGRLSRLVEKWFLSGQIGSVAWKIPTEFMYRKRIKQYYSRLNKPGKTFDIIEPGKIIDFMLMLPMALTTKVK